MDELSLFVDKLKTIFKGLPKDLPIEKARQILSEINDFLFTYIEKEYIENEHKDDKTFYFSDCHKYWKKHHEELLGATIDKKCCKEVANALHDVYKKTSGKAFLMLWDTANLKDEEICKIRFLTANQDFNGSRNFGEFAEIYKKDKTVFDVDNILNDPANFIKVLNLNKLSQTDKRGQYIKKLCEFLKENNCEPYKLIDKFNNDVYELRNKLIDHIGAGYGKKKTDMFIRDMVVLGVWKNVKNFDKIDVASDVNTMTIALRTGILKTEMPLFSSFMDFFGYQYSYIETLSAKAWRQVWEEWKNQYPQDKIESPCLLDYFIYEVVGKQFCKESLYIYECEVDKTHKIATTAKNKGKCDFCKNKVKLVEKLLPCSSDDGYIALQNTAFVKSGLANPNLTECPFKEICASQNKCLKPPKSISIKGQTGWTNGYSKKGEGGGGIRA